MRLIKLLRPLVVILALLGLAWAMRKAMHDADVGRVIHPSIIALALALYLTHYFVQSVGWHLILRSLGQDIRFGASCRMWYSSLMARWIPGPMVYSVARLYLAKENGLSVGVVAYAVLLELSYLMVGAFAVTIGLSGQLFVGALHNLGPSLPLLSGLLSMAFCAFVFRPQILRRLLASSLLRRILVKVTGSDLDLNNLPQVRTRDTLGLALFYGAFWAMSGLMFGVVGASLLPLGAQQMIACVPAFAGSWIIGFLAFLAPAGLGVREAALYAMLGSVISGPGAIALAIWSRILMLVAEFSSVATMWLVSRRKAPKSPVVGVAEEVVPAVAK